MTFEPMNIGSRTFDFSRPYIVGIINVTTDSFSGDGMAREPERAVERALEIVEAGADMVDMGGESTRPGAGSVPAREEIDRVVPIIKRLRRHTDVPVSIDTTKPQVAEAAVGEGADLINDVSMLRFGPELAVTAARLEVPLILMHSRKKPADMQEHVHYDDLFGEVRGELKAAMDTAMKNGVERSSIIIDPGIGFAKTVEHNLEIMSNLGFLSVLGRPIMVGPSRKSFIGKITGAGVDDRLGGTAAAVAVSVMEGANFLRVHDVAVVGQAAKIAFSLKECHTGTAT